MPGCVGGVASGAVEGAVGGGGKGWGIAPPRWEAGAADDWGLRVVDVVGAGRGLRERAGRVGWDD